MPRITQPVRSRTTSIRYADASETARLRSHDVFLYATQYSYSVGSTLMARVLRFSGVSTGHDGKNFALLLLESNYDTCSLSLSPRRERRRTHGTPKMNSWRFVEGSSTSAIVQRQRPAPGRVMTASPNWTGCIFFACLSMSLDRTTTYRMTTCTTATRLSLVVWHVWRFLVRYNNRRRRHRVDQNDHSFLSFFFHF